MIHFVESSSAAVRLAAARRAVGSSSPADEWLLVGASRGAIDDFARALARERGATFGLHRFSLTQFAARLAAPVLAERGIGPGTDLGLEAVAARATFESAREGRLQYFGPVADAPGFARALARTLLQLRLAAVAPASLRALARTGPDLADLLERFERQFAAAAAADRSALFEAASVALGRAAHPLGALPVLLLDVAIESRAEEIFVGALASSAPRVFATVPAEDAPTRRALDRLAAARDPAPDPDDAPAALVRLRTHLFNPEPPPVEDSPDEVRFFSAPGEGRESVEIARRILGEARQGLPFDQMAILVRAPQTYLGLLEHALARAGVPAWFDRGTERPDPAGRAFLALLACAVEGLSAARFAEYLSLGQVPRLDPEGAPPAPGPVWVPPPDDAIAPRQLDLFDAAPEAVADTGEAPPVDPPTSDAPAGERDGGEAEDPDGPVVAGTLRTPRKWEQLIVEAAVVGGRDRWRRRLDGLGRQYELQRAEVESDEIESPRARAITRDLAALEHLRRFALPIIDTMSGWGDTAIWSEWLTRLEALAPQVLRRPARVLEVLADLRPMGDVGPVSLQEVAQVLTHRLTTLDRRPPDRRYGRVFVGTPQQARGRSFEVVFVPGLAERLFPQRPREDPMLLDRLRRDLDVGLPLQGDRDEAERLLLRLAAGAARARLYFSYPRMDVTESRSRVPSFYALDVLRAVTGRIPSHEDIQEQAAREAQASLAWPAPRRPDDAIDDVEYDLALLRGLFDEPDRVRAEGRARHILLLNDFLHQSVRERWGRHSRRWTAYDGLRKATTRTDAALASHRLGARPYSLSALQRYSVCPYQFLLSAIYRLAAREEPEPLQRLDPLTRGSIFHRVQAEFFRELERRRAPDVAPQTLDEVLGLLEGVLSRVAEAYQDDLAPAIERVWLDEIGAIRADLRTWVHMLVDQIGEWEPALFEYGFGLPESSERDPRSRRDPVTIGDRFTLRGSVDLVERRAGAKELRVTDHKTGRDRWRPGQVVGAGAALQPVLYSLAVESALGEPVVEGRYFYCTSAGGFTDHVIPLDDRARRLGIEALEIIDRGVEQAVLLPAPSAGACAWCDFRPVCGPNEERRLSRKPLSALPDLEALRKLP